MSSPIAGRIRRLKIRSVIAILAVVAVVGATTAFAATSSTSHAYRTALVSRGAVAQQLHGSGTIQPVAQATVSFPIAGTVSSVAVAAGAKVTAGQTLATLDASSLEKR